MTQRPIDTIPPGGFGGAEPPQGVDPLPSWLGSHILGNEKVASMELKIGQQVAYG